jgi:hypothetical protein
VVAAEVHEPDFDVLVRAICFQNMLCRNPHAKRTEHQRSNRSYWNGRGGGERAESMQDRAVESSNGSEFREDLARL